MIVLKEVALSTASGWMAATEKPAPRLQRILATVHDDVVSFAICENSVRIISNDELAPVPEVVLHLETRRKRMIQLPVTIAETALRLH